MSEHSGDRAVGMPRVHLRGVLTQNVRGLGSSVCGPHRVAQVTHGIAGNDVSIVVLTETKLCSGAAARRAMMQANGEDVRWIARHSMFPQKVVGTGKAGVSMLLRSELAPYLAQPELLHGYALRQPIRCAGPGKRWLAVYGIYLPHESAECDKAVDWLARRVTADMEAGYEVMVAGDFNDDSLRDTRGPRRALRTQLSALGLVDAAATAGFGAVPTQFKLGDQAGGDARLDYVYLSPTLMHGLQDTGVAIDLHLVDTARNRAPLPAALPPKITVDHAAVVVKCDAWQHLLDRDYARAQLLAARAARRKVACWGSAAPEQRLQFREAAATALAASDFDACARQGRLEDACAALTAAVDRGALHLPTRTVGGGGVGRRGGGPADRHERVLSLVNKWTARRCSQALAHEACTMAAALGFDQDDVAGWGAPAAGERELRDRRRGAAHLRRALVIARDEHIRKNRAQAMARYQQECDEMFQTDTSTAIARAMGRWRPRATVDYVRVAEPEGSAVHEERTPSVVRAEVARQLQASFRSERIVDWDAAPPVYRDAFRTRVSHIDSDVWRGLMAPTSVAEIHEALAESHPDKAAGASGHPLRFYAELMDACGNRICALFNLCLRLRKTPVSWRQGVVYLIPKTLEGWMGSTDSARPITLLETLSKLLMKVLLQRIYAVFSQYDVLRGARFSGAPNTDTTVPIAILHALAASASADGRELWVYLEDKSKAFDTVPHDLLRAALERLHFPPEFVEFYCDGVLQERTVRVLTAYGPSDEVKIERGIPQGAVESPLMFNIFYDAILCAVAAQFPNGGVPLVAEVGIRRPLYVPHGAPVRDEPRFQEARERPSAATLGEQRVHVVAYMDDAAVYARSRDELQAMVDFIDGFNQFAGIKSNASKGYILAINAERPDDARIVAGPHGARVPVQWVPKSGARYLGVWVDPDMTGLAAIARAEADFCAGLVVAARRRPTAKVMTYLVNAVLLPALVYRAKLCTPPLPKLERLDQRASGAVRRALGGTSFVSNAVLRSPHLVGLYSVVDVMLAQQVTDIANLLNRPIDDLGGLAARTSIGLIQAVTRCPVSPLERPDLAHATGALSVRWRGPVAPYAHLVRTMAERGVAIEDCAREFALGGRGPAWCTGWLPLCLLAPNLLGGPRYLRSALAKTLQDADPAYWLEEIVGEVAGITAAEVARSAQRCSFAGRIAAWRMRAAAFESGNRQKAGSNKIRGDEAALGARARAIWSGREILEVLPRWQPLSDTLLPVEALHVDDEYLYDVKVFQREPNVLILGWKSDGENGQTDGGEAYPEDESYTLQVQGEVADGDDQSDKEYENNNKNGKEDDGGDMEAGEEGGDRTRRAEMVERREVVVYTDGSLMRGGKGEDQVWAGAAAVFPPPLDMTAGARLGPAPHSSTRSELMALLLAVATCPRGARLAVHTDSQVLINQAAVQLGPRATPNRRLGVASSDVWSAVRLTMHDRQVEVAGFVKVRGHTGDEGNEAADAAAKAAAMAPAIHELHPAVHALCDIPHRVTLGGVPMRGDPRKLILRCASSAHAHSITQDVRAAGVFAADADKVHWHATMLATNGGTPTRSLVTSRKLNKSMLFHARTLAGALPCRADLCDMYPDRLPRGPACLCGARDDQLHWLTCIDAADDIARARAQSTERARELSDELARTVPGARLRAVADRIFSSPDQMARAMACYVTRDDVALARASALPRPTRPPQMSLRDAADARREASVAAAKISKAVVAAVATLFRGAAADLHAAWAAHIKRQADADEGATAAAATVAAAADAAERPCERGQAPAHSARRRWRPTTAAPCDTCGRHERHHSPRFCASYRVARNAWIAVLRGADPLHVPGASGAAAIAA